MASPRPLVLITGAVGRIGSKLMHRLADHYRIVGLNRSADPVPLVFYRADVASRESLDAALAAVQKDHGSHIAAVVHLAAYFDFTGDDDPRYRAVNVEGTRNLVAALERFEVERFVYASTMLVHAPGNPGDVLTEDSPLDPQWAYPRSKAAAEAVVLGSGLPATVLRLAGVYDESVVIPTLAQQMARIYERHFEAYIFAGDPAAGQSLVHADDMVDAIVAAIDRRNDLPARQVLLVGEPEAAPYGELQRRLGLFAHAEERWQTLVLPRRIALAGTHMQHLVEPLIPNSIDQGERPFIRPFMIAMADHHYALDVSRAEAELGWTPRHRVLDELPMMVERMKADPVRWYRVNAVKRPRWMDQSMSKGKLPEIVRAGHEKTVRTQHARWLWAHRANAVLGVWLMLSQLLPGFGGGWAGPATAILGALLAVLALLSLDWRLQVMRLGAALAGLALVFVPLLAWTPDWQAYLNGTLGGGIAMALALVARPFPLVARAASQIGPDVPPGWDGSPSTVLQRIPIVVLALIGFAVSAYLTMVQLGHLAGVWDPFFDAPGAGNGSEAILGAHPFGRWPVAEAGLGAIASLLIVVLGLAGSGRRWRTIPWLVIAFGTLITTMSVVSAIFVAAQPLVFSTWCTLCLVTATAMLLMVPFALDEFLAVYLFMRRRWRAGAFVRALLFGDADEGDRPDRGEVERHLADTWRRITAGVGLPWTLALSIVIGVALMMTALVGSSGPMATAEHVLGTLIVATGVGACSEVARTLRLANISWGIALAVLPFVLGATPLMLGIDVAAGLALAGLSLPRGRIRGRYGSWSRYIR